MTTETRLESALQATRNMALLLAAEKQARKEAEQDAANLRAMIANYLFGESELTTESKPC